MIKNNSDANSFEDIWRKLSIEICQAIYITHEAQKLKAAVQKNGFLSLEEKSEFIDICNRVKYEVIQRHVGKEGTTGYSEFSEHWKDWFQKKGVESAHSKGQRDSVEHIMFGSTPEPEKFLLHFEQEVMGSMRKS